ncbi:MAG: hypothetical protein HY471_02160 [Candidatus Sungbacteria bacterium]|nr:hypothetical protein [Candidatus Sungbacteria bacterium]
MQIAKEPLERNRLAQRIMRRVYWYWFWKKEAPTLGMQLGILALVLVGIHEFVSVKFVLRNALETVPDMGSFLRFTGAAVQNTGFVPQLLFGALLILGLMVGRDVLKALRVLRASPKLNVLL